jgi:hypothetical protein
MTDDLRKQIARVLYEHQVLWDRTNGAWWCYCGARTEPGGAFKHAADAVLAALGEQTPPVSQEDPQ